jgi:hypothetical protein
MGIAGSTRSYHRKGSTDKRSSMVARGRQCVIIVEGPGGDIGDLIRDLMWGVCVLYYIFIYCISTLLTHVPPSSPLLTFRDRHS